MADYLSFEVSADVFKRSIATTQKILEYGCFEVREAKAVPVRTVSLVQMDPSHVALANLEMDNDIVLDLKEGEKFCLKMEKLSTVLSRLRSEDDTVRVSITGEDKVKVSFPRTGRDFTIPKLEEEFESITIPKIELEGGARARINTSELKSTIRDMKDVGCDYFNLNGVNPDELVMDCSTDGEAYTRRFKGKELPQYSPGLAKSRYNIEYLNSIATKDFGQVILNWKTDMPMSITYPLGMKSKLEFLLAPRVEG